MEKLKELIIEGEDIGAPARVKQLLDEGKGPETILKDSLIPAMDEVGKLYEKGEYFIPELLWSARAMQKSVDVLKPLLIKSGVKSVGTVIIGTVKGDRHDIGKNLVGLIFEGAGLEVIDLGVDVEPEKFVEAIKEYKPLAVGLSALLTSTMLVMKDILNAIQTVGLRDSVKIIIGGAPLNQAFCDEIKADYFTNDPRDAKNYILKLIK